MDSARGDVVSAGGVGASSLAASFPRSLQSLSDPLLNLVRGEGEAGATVAGAGLLREAARGKWRARGDVVSAGGMEASSSISLHSL